MPHKENPAEGHNPFGVLGYAQDGHKPAKKPKPRKKKNGIPQSGQVRRNPGRTMIAKRQRRRKRNAVGKR